MPLFFYREVRAVATFIKGHQEARNNYKGKKLRLFPDTRFSYADLMLGDFIENQEHIQDLADYLQRNSNSAEVKKINKNALTTFLNTINGHQDTADESNFRRVTALRKITKPLNKMIHHLEGGKSKASWIFPLFEALMKDLSTFKDDALVGRCFDLYRIGEIDKAIEERWLGHRSSTGRRLRALKSDLFIVGYLLDPYYTHDDDIDERVGNDWPEKFHNVVNGYFANHPQKKKLSEDAFDEVLKLLQLKGRWGDLAKEMQQSIQEQLEDKVFSSNVEKEIFCQQQMRETHDKWKFFGGEKFPTLTPIATRLSILAVQSANVERSCKAHGVIHTKSRNRLKNSKVQKLLFCYINLRLLHQDEDLSEVTNLIEAELDRVANEEAGDEVSNIGATSVHENADHRAYLFREYPTHNNSSNSTSRYGRCGVAHCQYHGLTSDDGMVLDGPSSFRCKQCKIPVHHLCAEEPDEDKVFYCSEICFLADKRNNE